MKYKTIREIETRREQILQEMNQDGADLDALKQEMEELGQNAGELREAAKAAEETRKAIVSGAANVVSISNVAETAPKGMDEIRSSKAYAEAYANYLKTNDDTECRSLLTTNVNAGQVPVPTMVDDIVRHAWENENILSRVRKTGFTGNVKVAFELSATGAAIHVEGTTAPDEEELTLGIVEIKPANIKKWITISDEMMETTGEGFLKYVFEELAYQIMKKLSYDIVGDIEAAPAANSATAVGVPVINGNPSVTAIANAAANLSDEANNLCVILNRQTEVDFLAAHAAANFAIDPFRGLPRVYTGALKAYSAASAGETYAIVADLSAIQANFPAGEGLKIKYDDLSLAERDLVKIVGRVYAGHEIVAPGRIVKMAKV